MRPDTLSRTSQDSHDIKPETLPNQSKPVGSQTHSRESSDASYITYVVWWRGNLSSKQVTIVALNPRHLINFHTTINNGYEPIWVNSFQSCRMTSFKEDNLRPHDHLWTWFTQLARSNGNLTKFKKDLTVKLDILMYNKFTVGILLANISHVSERWIS